MSASEFVFDVKTAEFETAVVARSQQVPILLDFWAEWCGPCKTLKPVLEQLAEEYGGAFLLGAVDTEVEQELAYAFQVQSIPFCVLLSGGRPVDGFQGALPEAEVRKFLAAAGIEPRAAAPADAPAEPEKPLDVARHALMDGQWQAAKEALASIPEEDDAIAAAKRMLDGFEVFESSIDAAESSAADSVARGRDLFLGKQYVAAVEAWIESIEQDRGWRNGLARRAAVMAFEVLGVNDAGRDVVREMRARMATLLY